MSIATGPGYAIRHAETAPTVPCPCGESTRILTASDGGPCSLHVTAIRDSVRHYHKETAEVYYVLEGIGKIELDGEWHEVSPGSVVSIEAGTRHRVVSEIGIRTVVVAIPPFNAEDEWFD